MANEQQQLYGLTDKQFQSLVKGYSKQSIDEQTALDSWRQIPFWGSLGQAADAYDNYFAAHDSGIPFLGLHYGSQTAQRTMGFSPNWGWLDVGYPLSVVAEWGESFANAGHKAVKHARSEFDAWKHAKDNPVSKVNKWELTGYPTQKRSDMQILHDQTLAYEQIGVKKQARDGYIMLAAATDRTSPDYAVYIRKARQLNAQVTRQQAARASQRRRPRRP